jgi:NAD(P)-dependent dehydrogenase (short-subunit alcohol dehydrogenase family)
MGQHNKTAPETGASRGIGRATALALAETGAHVLVHYGRSVQEAESVVEIIHIRSLPPTLKYDPEQSWRRETSSLVHGRFSGFGAPVNWIATDIVRIEDGVLVEHWDVIQDEVTQEQSKSGRPMFGDKFAT